MSEKVMNEKGEARKEKNAKVMNEKNRVLAECEQKLAALERECGEMVFPSVLGTKATAAWYGQGTIVAQDAEVITVRFGNVERRFLLDEKYPRRPRFENDEEYLRVCKEYRQKREEIERLKAEMKRLSGAGA